MKRIIKITAPDGFTVDKSWKGNFSNEQELLEDFKNSHTFLVGYKFELINEEVSTNVEDLKRKFDEQFYLDWN